MLFPHMCEVLYGLMCTGALTRGSKLYISYERRGLDLSDWRGKLEFWRRMTKKMATVT